MQQEALISNKFRCRPNCMPVALFGIVVGSWVWCGALGWVLVHSEKLETGIYIYNIT